MYDSYVTTFRWGIFWLFVGVMLWVGIIASVGKIIEYFGG